MPKAVGQAMDDPPAIVPLPIVEESRVQMPDFTGQCRADVTLPGETLTIMINGCKVTVNNNAGRDVIYHTISALREL